MNKQVSITMLIIAIVTIAFMLFMGPFKNNMQTHVSYDVFAKLNTDDMSITEKQMVKYRNTSSGKLNDVKFYILPPSTYKENKQNEKEFSDKKREELSGKTDIISVKDAATGHILSTTHEMNRLTVKFDKALTKKEEVTLQLEYKTKIPFGLKALSYYKDIINGADWFPTVEAVHSEETHTFVNEIADYKVSLNVPEKLQVVMPGQMSEQFVGAGHKTVTTMCKARAPFGFFTSEKFHKASKTKNGLTIEYMYYNDNDDPAKTSLINQYIDQAFKAFTFFNKKIGPYPYPEFRIVETHNTMLLSRFLDWLRCGV